MTPEHGRILTFSNAPARHGEAGDGELAEALNDSAPVAMIGWELGAGEGHLARMVPIVRALRERGWTVIAAVRDVARARSILGPVGGCAGPGRFVLGQAPIFLHRAPVSGACASLGEILSITGFGDAKLIAPVLRAWISLLERFKPDVAISDAAPTLNVAARGRAPVVTIGNGWTIPPEMDPLPPLLREHYGQASAIAAEQRICKAFTLASGKRIESAAGTLRGEANFVCTAPPLDPYADYRSDTLYWPPEVEIPPRAGQRSGPALIYLPKGHPAIDAVLAAVAVCGDQAQGYFGGSAKTGPPSVSVASHPLDFAALMPQAPYIIHHGGLGTANYALALGVPQLVLPTDLEKMLIGRGVERVSAGLTARPDRSAAAYAGSLQALSGRTAEASYFDSDRDGAATVDVLMGAVAALSMRGAEARRAAETGGRETTVLIEGNCEALVRGRVVAGEAA